MNKLLFIFMILFGFYNLSASDSEEIDIEAKKTPSINISSELEDVIVVEKELQKKESITDIDESSDEHTVIPEKENLGNYNTFEEFDTKIEIPKKVYEKAVEERNSILYENIKSSCWTSIFWKWSGWLLGTTAATAATGGVVCNGVGVYLNNQLLNGIGFGLTLGGGVIGGASIWAHNRSTVRLQNLERIIKTYKVQNSDSIV